MKHWTLFILISTIILLVACTTEQPIQPETATDDHTGATLVIGDISDEPAETIEGTQPLADFLAAQLADQGITQGEVKIAPDLNTMIQWMKDGEVDLYFDSPYPALIISQETGATPILRRLKYGVDQYHSVFITKADSELNNLADLSGKMVAFEEAFSTSGYMLPLAYLIENGMNPSLKSSLETAVSEDEVGYVFSTADNTTIQWLISGKVLVGVIDNVTFSRLPEETQAELKIIAATEDVPRQLVLVGADISQPLSDSIREALLAMDETEAGQEALDIFLTTKFDEFPDGAQKSLERMGELYALV
ncbi:MAG: phosphate/phosphite/phosphonate ABC transporter substrate-binding protein, partial [Anaerolineae bacterium]|nr:phosphate/phosphite/phosphonate ABC transporter substrate-binding protein [Anaerolineae bacterium]